MPVPDARLGGLLVSDLSSRVGYQIPNGISLPAYSNGDAIDVWRVSTTDYMPSRRILVSITRTHLTGEQAVPRERAISSPSLCRERPSHFIPTIPLARLKRRSRHFIGNWSMSLSRRRVDQVRWGHVPPMSPMAIIWQAVKTKTPRRT